MTPVVLPDGIALTVTLSAGVAAPRSIPEDKMVLRAAVDAALYAAKHEGRDRVVLANGSAVH